MKRMKFKCTLLSDIVLNQSSSSEGNQKTLDFIPGNNFLGIVAAILYNKVEKKDALDIFHSGKVRFGDAHPSVGAIRGLKVPAAMYYPKLEKPSERLFIHHGIGNQAEVRELQIKQCREGFFTFTDQRGTPIDTHKGFTIKSAYDSQKRRSKDGCMFGYEYLAKGLTLYFEVESDLAENINQQISQVLVGEKHIGHSRTAEFGLVKIERFEEGQEYQDVASNSSPIIINGEKFVAVYADARLMFLNENGEPTFQPQASDLKLNGDIVWEKSQIRTFQYTPWNGKRQSYDTDRCGIEKGSVIVVKLNDGAPCPSESLYVGAYNNEGFGRVIYNPAFLAFRTDENGKAEYTLEEKQKPVETQAESITPNTPLLRFLTAQQTATSARKRSYRIVEEEIDILSPLFRKGQFASQWGSIRSLAMVIPDGEQLKAAIDEFLSHGVAEAKWTEMGRKKALDTFMQELLADQNHRDNMQDIMINLASEMAKSCKED